MAAADSFLGRFGQPSPSLSWSSPGTMRHQPALTSLSDTETSPLGRYQAKRAHSGLSLCLHCLLKSWTEAVAWTSASFFTETSPGTTIRTALSPKTSSPMAFGGGWSTAKSASASARTKLQNNRKNDFENASCKVILPCTWFCSHL